MVDALSDLIGSEKGSLWLGALRSCMSKFDPTIDSDSADINEFPSFVACTKDGVVHALAGSLTSADLGPFLALASRNGASTLNLYLSPGAIPGKVSPSLSDVSAALSLQGQGFGVTVRVMLVSGSKLVHAEPKSTLQPILQDDRARQRFLGNPGASDVVDLVESAGCEALYMGDRMIATHLGLEVARSTWNEGRLDLQVGVGRNDRMAKHWLEDSRPRADKLRETVSMVDHYRLGDWRFHPLQRLSEARWMRLSVRSNPGLIGARELTELELARPSKWPAGRIWSLEVSASSPNDETSMYEGFDPSFEEDGLSFASVIDSDGRHLIAALSASIDLGAVAKLYEVTRSVQEQGVDVDGSILVMQERNRIVPIERLVDMADFDIRIASIEPTWRLTNRH